MSDARPVMLTGDDFIICVKDPRMHRRPPSEIGSLYCVRCRVPRKAAGDLAECQDTGKRLTLIAMCEVCETILRKPLARADLPKLRELLGVGLDERVP